MSWLDGILGRRQVKLSDPTSWHFDSASWSGKAVTPDSVLQLATAWACVRMNARTIGALPLQIFERVSDDERRLVSDHPLYGILHDSPNADQTAMEFWEGMLVALNLRGNAYAEKHYSGSTLIALVPLNPDYVTPYRAVDGSRRYRVSDPQASGRDLGEGQLFHLRGFGAGGLMGLSPIAHGRQTLGTALAADEVAGRTFSNGLQLSGFVEMLQGTKITKDQREELVALFKKFSGSTQAGKIMPLDPGMKFVPLGLSPEDAQLLETRGFHVEEICRWFGVPPILVGHASDGQTMFGSGVEHIMLAWLALSLQQELIRIEQAVKKQLMTPSERARFYAEHNIESLLRADSAGRAALYASSGQNGWMKRDEIRRKENMGRVPGGQIVTVQSNLIPLDQVGKIPPRAVQPAPGEPV